MDAVDLLNSDVAELPRTERDGTYANRLRAALDRYAVLVGALDADDFASQEIRAALPRIRALSEQLLAVHRAVLDGRPDRAHAEMTGALQIVSKELRALHSQPLDRDRLGHVFRLREAASSERVTRGGLFHMPFELRHRVTPKRYSVLGLPMLYLGSTLLICWEELGRPSFEKVWVAAMRLREGATVRLLDFGYRPALLAAKLHETGGAEGAASRFVVAHAILWPLIAACSFPKRFVDAAFIEEYILPQQVVAHLVETGDFDGVRYFSNRVSAYGAEMVNLNYVFPAQPGTDEGHCPKLTSLFEMTPPMPLPMVKLLGAQVNKGKPLLNSRRGIIELYPGHKVAYQYTQFAEIESYLLEQDFQPVC